MPHSVAAERWVVATGNRGKLAELESLLAPLAIVPVGQTALGIDSVPETGLTFVENALIKARHAAQHSGLPAIADDSGLCVDALGGAPGLRSARFAGDDADDATNVAALLERLSAVPEQARGAHFVCVLVALRHAEDPDPLIAAGRWHGRIATAPSGSGGFGYDPVFVMADTGTTAAQLDPASKHRLSHRGQALRKLVADWPRVADAGA